MRPFPQDVGVCEICASGESTCYSNNDFFVVINKCFSLEISMRLLNSLTCIDQGFSYLNYESIQGDGMHTACKVRE